MSRQMLCLTLELQEGIRQSPSSQRVHGLVGESQSYKVSEMLQDASVEGVGEQPFLLVRMAGSWECLSYAALTLKELDFSIKQTQAIYLVCCTCTQACIQEHKLWNQITWVQIPALSLINYETWTINLCLNFFTSKMGIIKRVTIS